MKLYTKAQHRTLIKQGQASAAMLAANDNLDGDTPDHWPVVKWFDPCGAATWLVSELDPDDPDVAFGLADLGMGAPELGKIDVAELRRYRGPVGLGIERDLHFRSDKSLREYAEEARKFGRIAT